LWSAIEKEVFYSSFDGEFGSIFCILDIDGLRIHLGSSISYVLVNAITFTKLSVIFLASSLKCVLSANLPALK